jgi:hypothetical protein
VYNFTLFSTQKFFGTTFVHLIPFSLHLAPTPNLLFHIVSSLSSTMARATKKAKTTATVNTTSIGSTRSLSRVVPPAAAAPCSANYTIDEDIWLCSAFVKATLNAKSGVGMRRDKFWSLVKSNFDAIQANELAVVSNNGGGSDDDSVLESKKQDSLYQRFGRKIAPEVKRFLVVHHANKENSGENEEAYHSRLLLLFESRFGTSFQVPPLRALSARCPEIF